jgi:hypothetical protein
VLRPLLAGLIVAAAYVASSPSWATPLPTIDECPKVNRTVIPGCYTWTIETNKIGGDEADLWWRYDTERLLVPENVVTMAVMPLGFESVHLADLKSAKLDNQKIPASDLRPGTVLGVRTRKGSYAKLRVVRYYRRHDFSFPGLTEDLRKFALSELDQDNYNIEFEWVFYKVP